jgi:hypothetical protein
MADEDHRSLEEVEHAADLSDVILQVTEGPRIIAMSGKIDSRNWHVARRQARDDALPAPSPVPGAVYENDGCRCVSR